MRLGLEIVWLAAAAAAVGCSVDARSQGFECTDNGRCDSGRICEQGWCVIGTPDASPDGEGCPEVCTACVGTTCEIDCSADGACDAADIECPAGFDCAIDCGGGGSCDANIDCTNADECLVLCGGDGSCTGDVTCPATGDCRVDCDGTASCDGAINGGSGRADVNCTGTDSCNGDIDCSMSCACEVDCAGGCPEPVSCPMGADCQGNDGGCDDVGQCNNC